MKDHGRIEQRSIWVTERLNEYVEFPHVKLAFAMQRRVMDTKGKKQETVELACSVTSLSLQQTTAEEVLKVNRGHWTVEASHHILDNPHAFDEDQSRIRPIMGPRTWPACVVSH